MRDQIFYASGFNDRNKKKDHQKWASSLVLRGLTSLEINTILISHRQSWLLWNCRKSRICISEDSRQRISKCLCKLIQPLCTNEHAKKLNDQPDQIRAFYPDGYDDEHYVPNLPKWVSLSFEMSTQKSSMAHPDKISISNILLSTEQNGEYHSQG